MVDESENQNSNNPTDDYARKKAQYDSIICNYFLSFSFLYSQAKSTSRLIQEKGRFTAKDQAEDLARYLSRAERSKYLTEEAPVRA
jgi:hypothetical protein